MYIKVPTYLDEVPTRRLAPYTLLRSKNMKVLEMFIAQKACKRNCDRKKCNKKIKNKFYYRLNKTLCKWYILISNAPWRKIEL